MNQPLVSIIVPVYNVEPYVENCIRSVMNQSYGGPMECIVVDDCGADNSMCIVEKLITEYKGPVSFKLLHHEHNRGLSAARNTGMDAAIGDYLFFLDSDDVLTTDCLEKLTKPLEKELYDVVMGNVQCYQILPSGEKEKIKRHLELSLTADLQLDTQMMMQTVYEWDNLTAWNRLFRTDFIRHYHLQFMEGVLYEDHLWSFQITSLAASFYVVNHVTYYYQRREGSIDYNFDSGKYTMNLMAMIKEMGIFTDKYQIDRDGVYQSFRFFFRKVLNYYSTSISDYVSVYQELRPYIKAPLRSVVQANDYNFKLIFHDIHFTMPVSIAPYWQYHIHRPLCQVKSVITNHLYGSSVS
ncbi:MAG: glycosyltransferase family 2 protein [Bacteroidaceae bacterium]|nr:glycosyltransferase family 2 protein [Bacteroidaceae bacterium]